MLKLLPSSPVTMRRLVATSVPLYAFILAIVGWLLYPRIVLDKDPGWIGTLSTPQTVRSVDPGGAAAGKLFAGDTILAIDHDFSFRGDYAPSKKLHEVAPGATYHVDLVRNGRPVQLDLVLRETHTWRHVPLLLLYGAGSLSFLVCGFIMGWNRPEDRVARLGWLACYLTAILYVRLLCEDFPNWYSPLPLRLIYLVHPWHLFATYCFVAALGASRPETRLWRGVRGVLLLLTALTWLRAFADDDWLWTRAVHGVMPEWVWRLWFWFRSLRMALVAVAIFAVAARNYCGNRNPRERRALEIVAGAIALGVGSVVLASVSAYMLDADQPSVALQVANTVPLVIPFCFCYAVVAHRVLDIRLVFRKGLQYLLARQVLRVLFLLPLLWIVVTALRHPDAPIRSMVNLSGLLLVVSIALCLEFRERIQTRVDRWFFRERFDRERLLRELLAEISKATTPGQITSLVQMRIKFLYRPAFVTLSQPGESCPEHGVGGDLSFPLHALDGRQLGCLTVGVRLADVPYTAEDRELLHLVAAQAGLMLDVLESSRQASDVGQAILEERSRIALELHDTAGQGLVVDDHPLLRSGLAAVIDLEPDMKVVATAGSGEEAIRLFREMQPDVVTMDLKMPGAGGRSAIGAICTEFPQARVLVLSSIQAEEPICEAIRAGATGYLLKDSDTEELLSAIRSTHAGKRTLSAEVASVMADALLKERLSARELDILRCVARGLSNREAGEHLQVTENTVKGYLKTIAVKLDAEDRTAAVTIALKRGLLQLDDL